MTPSLMVMEVETTALLSVSGVASGDINYGGVDENGSLEPSAPDMLDEIEF